MGRGTPFLMPSLCVALHRIACWGAGEVVVVVLGRWYLDFLVNCWLEVR